MKENGTVDGETRVDGSVDVRGEFNVDVRDVSGATNVNVK